MHPTCEQSEMKICTAYHQESAAAHEQSRREKEMSARFTQVVGRNGAVLVGVWYDV